MELLTAEILAKIPHLDHDIKNISKARIYIKFYVLPSCPAWYAIKFCRKTATFFGFTNLIGDDLAQLEYFTLDQLKNINIQGYKVRRDTSWNDKITLDKVMNFKVR